MVRWWAAPRSFSRSPGSLFSRFNSALFEALDARFPSANETDKIGDSLKLLFAAKPLKDELTKSYVGRLRNLFSKCALAKVPFNEDVQGWLMIHFARLDDDKVAMILSITNGSYKIADVAKAMRSAYPNKLPTSTKPAHIKATFAV